MALNFTPVPRVSHVIGVPHGGTWRECAEHRRQGVLGERYGEPRRGGGGRGKPAHGRPYSLRIVLPPLGAVVFAHDA
ncbi:alpha amylase C-terminal domain-containing protein [Tepidiforma flava]|uniref:Alpha amylase C-terminal domain-containing protein n=1 Tax=Tepidiforma flava TaxID=3004094 RepID=A0ABY7M511_9CHLR|nr:alpha amylase C-terminal domain-containing protein [Tepidiforma flava]WBL35247.1 alpha amylase C-terminal domain-containing protein [Tepidiforma flava]